MKLGCCVPLSQISVFPVIDKFDFIEVNLDELINSPGSFSGHPIYAVNSIFPREINIFSIHKKKVFELIDYIFSVCSSHSIKVITIGSGRSRSYLENQDKKKIRKVWLEILSYFDKKAGQQGIKVGIEPLVKSETNFINSFTEALTYLNSSEFKNIGITLDTYHFLSEENSFNVLSENIDKVIHFHISGRSRNYPLNLSKVNSKFINLLIKNKYKYNASIEIDRKKNLLNSVTFINKFRHMKDEN